jgi:release factor glutamine methyltransferase
VTIRDAIAQHEPTLHEAGIETPRVDVEWMLVHLLGLTRTGLQLEAGRMLAPDEAEQLGALVAQRAGRIPLQHLLGEVDFYGLRLRVDGRVLVPRPETELLAEAAIGLLRGVAAPFVLDVGTGSGCLAIAIAVACPDARIDALDISSAALALAMENADRHQVSCRIQCLEGDGREPLPGGPYDLIVSNPPYIPTGDLAGLQPEVRDHDPRLALDGGADGMDFYRALAAGGAASLRSTGRMLLEICDGQAQSVGELLLSHGWLVERTIEDLAGLPRIVIATPAVS